MLATKKTLSVVAIFVIALAMSVDAKKYVVKETVNVRSAPSVNAKIVRSARAGTYVDVTCQTTGDKVQNSNIWDKLTDGNYVFDQYVKTGYSGFSPDLPRCKASTSPGTPNNGKINKEGLKLIEEFEGFRANFYIDPAGIKTIGYGHACHVDPNKCNTIKAPITRAQGEALLKKDLVKYEKCVSANTSVKLNSNQFSGLVSFTFNLGCGAYRDSTLRKKLNAGDTKGAAAQFGRWVYAGGKKLQGLVRRREAERKLFCKSGGC